MSTSHTAEVPAVVLKVSGLRVLPKYIYYRKTRIPISCMVSFYFDLQPSKKISIGILTLQIREVQGPVSITYPEDRRVEVQT